MIAPGQPYKWNQFVVQDKLPDAKTGGANANVDFLTATAWIDTRDDPIVLTIPEQVRACLPACLRLFMCWCRRLVGRAALALPWLTPFPPPRTLTTTTGQPGPVHVGADDLHQGLRDGLRGDAHGGEEGRERALLHPEPRHAAQDGPRCVLACVLPTCLCRLCLCLSPPCLAHRNTKTQNAGGLFKTILYSDSDYSRVQARVGPITGPADVDKAKQLLAGFKVTPLTEFLEGQIGTKAIPPRKARTPDPKFYPWNDNLLKARQVAELRGLVRCPTDVTLTPACTYMRIKQHTGG